MTPDSPGFRAQARGDWRWRVTDLLLHVAAALVLPCWSLQFLPDAALPTLWLRAVVRDRFDADASRMLVVHRVLHLRPGYWMFGTAIYAAAFSVTANIWLPVHVAVHIVIDRLTHDGRWQ